MTTIQFGAKFEGEYRFVVTRAGAQVNDTGWFKNLILNQGLDTLAAMSGGNPISYCRVGTGTSTPAATQTQLDSQLAASSSINGASSRTTSGAPNYQSVLTYTYVFAQGAVVGNVTEVGVGSGSTGTNLFSRALILDGSGNPTTLALVAIDQLTVYYRVRVSPPITDGSGTVTLGGTPYSYQTRLLDANNFFSSTYSLSAFPYHSTSPVASFYRTSSGFNTYAASGSGLAAITATSPLGTNSGSLSTLGFSTATYTAGSFIQDSTLTFAPADGNATGGIGALKVSFGSADSVFQVYFPTPIPKDNTKTLTLTFRYTWSR